MAYVDALLAPGEEKLYIAHRHIVFVIGGIVARVLLALALIAAAVAAKLLYLDRQRTLGPNAGNIAVFVGLLLALVPLVQALFAVLAWRNEEYVVTSRRVIQAQGIFGKRTFDYSLNTINDLITQQSPLGRIFNYGSLQILTGNDESGGEYRGIADPLTFKKALLVAREQFLRQLSSGGYAPAPQHADDPNEITALIAQLAQLRQQGAISQAEYDAKRAELLRRL